MLTLARLLALAIALHGFLLPSLPAHANELSVLAGVTRGFGAEDEFFAWQAEYRYNFLRNFAASLSWINEGGPQDHRRDGITAQAWGRAPLLGNRVSIGFGAIIYCYTLDS